MSVWSLTYTNKACFSAIRVAHSSEFLPTRWRQKSPGIDMDYVTVVSPYVLCENGEWAGSGQTRVGPKYHVLDGVQIRSPTPAGLLCKYVRLSCVFYCKLVYLLIRLCDICQITLAACSFSTSVCRTGSALLHVANRWRGALICIHRNLCSFSSSFYF